MQKTDLFELVADEGEGLENGLTGAGDCDNPLRTGPVCDVDLGPALQNSDYDQDFEAE